jgi:predicted nucleotidyltransferase
LRYHSAHKQQREHNPQETGSGVERMKQKTFDLSQVERDRLSRRLGDVLRNHDEPVFAYVYGSFVEGVPFHDIDVGIYISKIDEKEVSSYNQPWAKL